MIEDSGKKVKCDMKSVCFNCKANSILENPSGEQIFYHCISCGTDILCNMAIGQQFDKKTNRMKETCPKCRGKLLILHFPLNLDELKKLIS